MEWSTAVGIIVGIIGILVVFATFIYSSIMGSRFKTERKVIIEKIDDLAKDIEAKQFKESIADRKKFEICKMGLKTFYYIDASQVDDLYPQIFTDLEPKQIEILEKKGKKGGVSAELKFISPNIEISKAEETKKIFELKRTPALMYNKVEEYLFSKNKVIFGLDEFEYEQSSIDEFKTMCEKMKEKFNLDISDEDQITYIADKMREYAIRNIEKLSNSIGYVALQNSFVVVSKSNDVHILSYDHVMNENLSSEDGNVKIQIVCTEKYLTPSGISAFDLNKSVKITCIGKILSWSSEEKILSVNPIAIY